MIGQRGCRAHLVRGVMQAQKSPQAVFGDHAQQPSDVVAGSAQYGLDAIADLAFEVTAVESVIGFQVADNRFDGLASFEQFHADWAQSLFLAPVADFDLGVVVIDAAVAQIGVDGGGRGACVLHQDRGLFELLVQERNCWPRPTAATSAVAVSCPIPGTDSRRLAKSDWLAIAAISLVTEATLSSSTRKSCQSAERRRRIAGVKSFASSAMISGMCCLKAATPFRMGNPYSRQYARISETSLVREETMRSLARCSA